GSGRRSPRRWPPASRGSRPPGRGSERAAGGRGRRRPRRPLPGPGPAEGRRRRHGLRAGRATGRPAAGLPAARRRAGRAGPGAVPATRIPRVVPGHLLRREHAADGGERTAEAAERAAADGRRFGVADERLTAMSPAELHALTAKLIRSWHPDLRALHARAAVDETFLVRICTSPPVPPWPPSRVTVLGDAIHAMSPARGSGANTALQDAALLCGTLTGSIRDGGDLITAVGKYE